MRLLKKHWLAFIRFAKRQLFAMFIVSLQLLPCSAMAFSAYTTDELDELENEFIQLINQSNSVERNPLAFQYINHIGKKLTASSTALRPYFFIVKSDEINAFAGPGGYIGINTQLILATENESELAAVMAHEIAHVRLHHLYYMLEHQKQMRIPMLASVLASIALGVLNPALGTGAMMASLTGFNQDNINFVRSNEKEADRIGIRMLTKAGFNPWGMPGFFKKMQENSRYYYTDNIPAILRSHPLDEDRIAEAENRISVGKNKRYPNNPDYHLFKELIRNDMIADHQKLTDFYQQQCPKSQPHDACSYGQALNLIKLNHFQQAKDSLAKLIDKHPDNLYFQIAMADSETGLKMYQPSLLRLKRLGMNYPDNYAALMAYVNVLMASGHYEQATSLLIKGRRQFKKDLPLCKTLARAQANTNQKGYAYLTQSQCMLLEGRHRDAVRLLKVAKSTAKKDKYLLARIDALIDEAKYLAGISK